jgi:hypothetical protein
MSSANPKPSPGPTLTRLASDALIETIDGPVEVDKLAGKAMPVLTRFPDGSLGFRMMREIRLVEPNGAMVELENGDGQTVRVGVAHVFVRSDGREVPAGDLAPGDRLEAGWSYPPGYELPDEQEYAAGVRGHPWKAAVMIVSVRPAGAGPLYGGSVNQTKGFFLTFGARCRAQP